MNHLLIAVLSYSPLIHWEVTNSINEAVAALSQTGQWNVSTYFHAGEADIARSRNIILSLFHSSPATDLLCIDSDVSWKEGSVERLLSHPVDLVFGCYPQRTDTVFFPARAYVGPGSCIDPITGEEKTEGLIDAQGGPAGFMRITKRCANKLIQTHEDRWYEEPRAPNGKAWSLFEFGVRGNRRRSEDIEFCKRWTDLGEHCWLDPWLSFRHHGTKAFQGTMGLELLKAWEQMDKERTSHVRPPIQEILPPLLDDIETSTTPS